MPVRDDVITSQERRERLGYAPVIPPYRSPEERVQDFAECALGFSLEDAMAEATRCLHCPQPSACVVACPVGNDIPTALWYIEQGDIESAANVYRADRKSTRLNSSHQLISYAVFCL